MTKEANHLSNDGGCIKKLDYLKMKEYLYRKIKSYFRDITPLSRF